MSLFQSSVLQKYINALDSAVVDAAYERFTAHFHDAGTQENIRNAKEEQYQGGFLIDLFVKVLGYVKNPSPGFNLTTELKNVKDSKKPMARSSPRPAPHFDSAQCPVRESSR
jgi:hypothetical protein